MTKTVPPELVEYLCGSPDSTSQENRATRIIYHLSDLLLVRHHPVEAAIRIKIEAAWAAFTLRQIVTNPAFCDDLRLAIGRINNGSSGLNKKHCLAQAYLILSGYQDWWAKSPELRSPGIPVFFSPDPQVGDPVYFASLSAKELAYVQWLRTEYQGQVNSLVVDKLAMFMWRHHNRLEQDQAELDFQDGSSRKQWSRWRDELGLTPKILPRNPGGRRG